MRNTRDMYNTSWPRFFVTLLTLGCLISRIVSGELRTRLLWPAMAMALALDEECAECL